RRTPLDEAMRGRCETTYRELSAQGSRVLAVAYAVAPLQAAYSARDERELVLAGFVTFFDPPMKGVAETLRALRRDGVVVKILTGDNELVAQHLCGQVGLDSARIVGGDQIERVTDSALAAVAEQTTVFARVSPRRKTASSSRSRVATTSSASWATASTTRLPSTRRTSACPSRPPSTLPRTLPTSSCLNATWTSYTPEFSRAAGPSAT